MSDQSSDTYNIHEELQAIPTIGILQMAKRGKCRFKKGQSLL
tara:strand:- start:90 stop:215 length:126 start_codon:yes stop_codon:yes gene_type:complete